LTALSDDPDRTINVVGFRWNWTFNYVDDDVYDTGSPNEFPTLYLPEGETVRFVLTSPDVLHSFWVPAFLFKRDVIPGRSNEFDLTPNKVGTYAGKCAELCGVDHSRMLFNVKVVPLDEYERHIADLEAAGQTGLLETGRVTTDADSGQGRTVLGGDS
jgi:cytochrome c oxidase subunit 2